MANAIASCFRTLNDVAARATLYELGEFYLVHLIRPMRKHQGGTPMPSSHPSRLSFDKPIRADIQSPSSRGDVKSVAMVRDGYRCMVTRCPDLNVFLKERRDLLYLAKRSSLPFTPTECCHIIPYSINDMKNVNEEKFGWKFEGTSIFWGILQSFGYHLQPELNGNNINRPENVMTLTHALHGLFDDLDFWLEEVEGQENTYRTCLSSNFDDAQARESLHLPPTVQFIVHDVDDLASSGARGSSTSQVQPRHLALPNPKYLRIHAACCKVAHLSGAAEYLEEVYRDVDSLEVLANDGSSAQVLDAALWRIGNLVPPV
ncbi:hypothetical protein FOMPIDRAFT_1147471 [Fomitopsis schrenkii]|uniref:HNH nuclease domain-containing protein n=1 Tax=Fomitopsis schrenkii TaxID=2126942 RepID=S8E7M7_FOMSC|nr:hypothetical protein FOMPIDRAFT_1147471 [Fomitopsis schrenkii]